MYSGSFSLVHLLPTTNSQRQEIEGRERKATQSGSLEDRTDRVRIAGTWKPSLTCCTANVYWILDTQLWTKHIQKSKSTPAVTVLVSVRAQLTPFKHFSPRVTILHQFLQHCSLQVLWRTPKSSVGGNRLGHLWHETITEVPPSAFPRSHSNSFPFLFPYFPLPPWPTVFHRGCLGKHSPLPVHYKGLKRPLTSICEGFLKRDQDVRSPKQTELSTKGRCQHVLCRFRQGGFDEFWLCRLLAVWAVIYHLIGPNTYLIKFLKVASIL